MNVRRPLRQELAWSLLKTAALLGVSALLVYAVLPKLAGDYRSFPGLDSRTVVWLIMELHLMFAAFVLGIPIFALIVEIVGAATRDERYDRLAWNFTQLFALAVVATAVSGVAGLGALVVLYPKFMNFLGSIFSPTYLAYAGAIVLNAILFAGYYLGKEMYAYSAQMGTTLMGGVFSWLFIIQAVLIGVLFIGANYYMWLGRGRIPGGHRYYKYVFSMEILIFVSMAVWMTPHTLVASLAEARRMGGAHHPLLGVLGVMSAKNTAMNLVLLTTFLSFVLYRRANKQRQVRRSKGGLGAPVFIAALSLFPVLYGGVNGFVSAGAKAERLVLLAVTFTLTIGLMGFVRSGIREAWHVYGVVRDLSPSAYTPTLGYGAWVVAAATLLFLALLFLLFRYGLRDQRT